MPDYLCIIIETGIIKGNQMDDRILVSIVRWTGGGWFIYHLITSEVKVQDLGSLNALISAMNLLIRP